MKQIAFQANIQKYSKFNLEIFTKYYYKYLFLLNIINTVLKYKIFILYFNNI